MTTAPYHVSLDERRYPGRTVVIVREPGLTMLWPFFAREHAEQKARAETERLRAEFPL